MTNDKTRQEGPPAADPIRQETGGQEPPAADQASAKPVKKRGRPKKKKIIVVEGSKDQLTAASLLTEDQAAAEGQEPTNWQDMTPHEFIEYAKDNPEAARQDIQDYFSAGEGKEAADNLITAARAMQEITKAFTAEAQEATAETNVKIVARQLKQLNFSISKIISAMCRVNELGALPEGADEDELDRFYDEWDALEPFVNAILAADPARKGMNAEQLLDTIPLWAVYHVDNMDGIDEKAQDAQEAANIKAVIEIIQRARAARDQAAERAKYTPTQIRGTDKIEYPVDKPNNNFWDNAWRTLTENPDGQLTFSFDMAKSGSKKELPLLLSINFDDLQDIHITKKLTPFDKRVYIAVSALFTAGNTVITLSQIYKHMGYKGRAGAADLKKIHECIVKMMGAQISVDNELEANTYKKYSHFTYRGVLLPVEIGELYDVQGALTDAAIHILKEPPLMTFARQRDQLTTVSLKLLQSPVSKTDANLAIDDYLIVHIKRAQKGKDHGRHRMLFKTIYKHTGIPEKPTTNAEKQQKKRAPGKIEKYLTHYQTEGTITRYEMEKDGITVFW